MRVDLKCKFELVCLLRVSEDDSMPSVALLYGEDLELKVTVASEPLFQRCFTQIASYTFGNLKLLLRFQVDCVEPLEGTSHR